MRIKETGWLVYDCIDHNVLKCFSKEEAMVEAQAILDSYGEDDGYPEEIGLGGIMIAQVVTKSAYEVIDSQENYEDPEEDWPYDSCFDTIGEAYMQDL